MSGYGKKVEEQVFNNDWFSAGIQENIYVQKVELASYGDSKECADITYGNKEGQSIKARVFPFVYNASLTKTVKDEKVPFTEDEQFDNYLVKFKHIFSKAVGEENYDKGIAKATDFKSFIGILSKMALESNPNSKPFRLMIINKENTKDGKRYNIVPNWTGGFCESMDVNPSKLKWDEAKYGAKKKDASKIETVEDSSSDDVPDFLK